jgi:hypothetical protein
LGGSEANSYTKSITWLTLVVDDFKVYVAIVAGIVLAIREILTISNRDTLNILQLAKEEAYRRYSTDADFVTDPSQV